MGCEDGRRKIETHVLNRGELGVAARWTVKTEPHPLATLIEMGCEQTGGKYAAAPTYLIGPWELAPHPASQKAQGVAWPRSLYPVILAA